jgi:hypothetical protein
VLELGNKTTRRGVPYRDWYVDQGCEYTSLDWNGRDGALPLDLQKTIDPTSIGGPFDLVTNFGTTEHVEDQEKCWENVHGFVALGGRFVNHTPHPNCHEYHGFWYPSVEWFEEFASTNGYEIEYLGVVRNSWKIIHASMTKKVALPFSFPETEIYRTLRKFI